MGRRLLLLALVVFAAVAIIVDPAFGTHASGEVEGSTAVADLLRYLALGISATIAIVGWSHIKLHFACWPPPIKNTILWFWICYTLAMLVIGVSVIDQLGTDFRWVTPIRPLILIPSLLIMLKMFHDDRTIALSMREAMRDAEKEDNLKKTSV